MAKFKKGQSGNPSGRPKVPKDVREAVLKSASEFSVQAMKILCALAKNAKTPPSIRLHAIDVILNRSLGKPLSTHEVTGLDGSKLMPDAEQYSYLELARRMAFILNRGAKEQAAAAKQDDKPVAELPPGPLN